MVGVRCYGKSFHREGREGHEGGGRWQVLGRWVLAPRRACPPDAGDHGPGTREIRRAPARGFIRLTPLAPLFCAPSPATPPVPPAG